MLYANSLVSETWKRLTSDFLSSSVTKSTYPLEEARKMLAKGGVHRRSIFKPELSKLDSETAKRLYQIAEFGKRWIFADDVLTPLEIEIATKDEFLETQASVLKDIAPSPLVDRWLDEAKALNECILGKYDAEEHHSRCRFGSKAAYGLPRKEAYLFNRMRKLSGSASQTKFMVQSCRRDAQLSAIARAEFIRQQQEAVNAKIKPCTALVVTVVPKSYKAGRSIVPDTVIGGFSSAGLGEMVVERLRVNAGLDLAVLQAAHVKTAQRASVNGYLVTADMSKASDRISWSLLQRVLPSDWFDVLKADWIGRVQLSNPASCIKTRERKDVKREYNIASPLLMGKGHTFPVQTLVFYSLLMSLMSLNFKNGHVSVYGDDLIYPNWMHNQVLTLFPRVGLKINTDKTFAGLPVQSLFSPEKGCFRESCGGDFLHGVNVRPYMPKGRSEVVDGEEVPMKKHDYAALCYKMLNGLLEHWKPEDIRMTIRYLLIEVQAVMGTLFLVPKSDGAIAGLKLDESWNVWLQEIEESFDVEQPVPLTRLYPKKGYLDQYVYRRLKLKVEYTKAEDEWIYVWDALRRAQEKAEREKVEPPCQFTWRAPENRGHSSTHLYEAKAETLIIRSKKAWVTKDNQYHDVKPEQLAQRTVLRIACVQSREEEVGHVEDEESSIPLHVLFSH